MAITRLNSLAIPAGTVEPADISYPLTNFASTGIDDNATSTVLTVNQNNGLLIDSSGTTTIQATGATHSIVRVMSGDDTSYGTVVFGDTSSNTSGQILYTHSNDAMTFKTNNTTALTINSSQNTTFAGQVTATNAVLEGASDSILTLRSTDDGPLYMEFERGTDRHAYLGFGGSNDQFKINNEESGGTIQLLTANTAAVTIDSSQNTTFAGEVTVSKIISSTSGNIAAAFTSTTATAKLTITDANDTAFIDVNATRLGIGHASSTSLQALQIEPTSAEAMRIDTAGNVGIGTSSPSLSGFGSGTNGLEIADATVAGIRLNGNAADSMYFVSGAGQHWLYGKGAVPMTFSTNGTEAMRIDSSGKVLINETTFNSGFSPFAQMQISNSTAPGLVINTDTAGASNYGRLAFTIGNSTGNEGLIRYNSNDYHMSFWTNSGERMRILAGGGITFNGDTAAANALDDYEEGTYTAGLYDASTGGNVSSTTRTGYYTKIGRMVTVSFWGWNNINTSNLTANNPVYISLPFAAGSTGRHVGNLNHHGWTYAGSTSGRTTIMPQVTQSSSRFYFVANGNGLSDINVLVSDISSGADDIVTLTLTYHV